MYAINVDRCYVIYQKLIPNLMTFEEYIRDSKIDIILYER